MDNSQKLRDLAGGAYDEMTYLKESIDTASLPENYTRINDQCQTIMMMLDIIVAIANEEGAKYEQ